MTSVLALSLLAGGAAMAQDGPGMRYRGVPMDRPQQGQPQAQPQAQPQGGGQDGAARFQRPGGGQRGDRGDGGGQRFDRGDRGEGGQRQRPPQQAQPQQAAPQQTAPQPQRGDDRRDPGRRDDRFDGRPDGRNDGRNDDRPGMRYRGVPYQNGARPDQNRPPQWRPGDQRPDQRFRDRDRGRQQYDERRWRPSYRPQQRFRAPAWRPPVGFYAYNWRFGDYLPGGWFGPSYYLNWGSYGLPLPPIGCEWVRVGDDAILVDTWTGRVLSVAYDIFW